MKACSDNTEAIANIYYESVTNRFFKRLKINKYVQVKPPIRNAAMSPFKITTVDVSTSTDLAMKLPRYCKQMVRDSSRSFTETSEVYEPDTANIKPETIKKNLPITFRARYGKIQSTIDALEIEIEKPSDPVKQALSWSDYKLLTEKCGYLDVLPNGAWIMADRGFKNINSIFIKKECKPIRSPSVEKDKKLSKEEVLETKKIASLRIHIERTIRRIRKFKFLKPH
ncbi:hypothetical protein ILUMI_21720 [Ignelater luminosus]|uniref:DDE Tnp4 domain-containing protein n=1 Tax=Ignelater luminosus TaxID=2038154 RepID=A0A8K0CBX2_IGNLU|nr:hypothetical protein ILUMI_21720 [Ignelater luminosus]